MKAIRDTGNKLAAAMDVNDRAGMIDGHVAKAQLFTGCELFNAHVKEAALLFRPVCSRIKMDQGFMSGC